MYTISWVLRWVRIYQRFMLKFRVRQGFPQFLYWNLVKYTDNGSSLSIDNRWSNAENRHFYNAALLALRKTWLYDSMLPGDWRVKVHSWRHAVAASGFGLPDPDLHAPNSKSANFSANTVFWVRGIMTKIVPYYMKNLLQGSVDGRFTCPLNKRDAG